MTKRSTLKKRKARQKLRRSLADDRQTAVNEPKQKANTDDAHTNADQTSSPHKGRDEAVRGENGKNERQRYLDAKDKNWPQRIQAVCAVLLVLITGLYTHYARKQVIAANSASEAATQTLNTAQNQFKLDQRPYVAVMGFVSLDYRTKKPGAPIKGKPVWVVVNFKNIGKTHAVNVVLHRHMLFKSHASELKIEPADSLSGGDVIDPGGTTFTETASFVDTYKHEAMGPYAVSDLLNWDGTEITVFGRVTYKDTAGTVYCTPFFTTYVPSNSWTHNGDINIPEQTSIHNAKDFCPIGNQ